MPPPPNHPPSPSPTSSVLLLLLGDLGRSPRMRYHAQSLSSASIPVHIIAYRGSAAPPTSFTRDHPNISVSYLPEVPKVLQDHLPRALALPLKLVHQAVFLTLYILSTVIFRQFLPSTILVQNPPALPTLPLAYLTSLLLRADLLIDWHNYAWSIMALSTPKRQNDPLVRLAKFLEDFFGRRGDLHFTVTNGMRRDLMERLGIQDSRVRTLYDRPAGQFRFLTQGEREEFLEGFLGRFPGGVNEENGGNILVSSTSWTEDEDFGVLLEALRDYESAAESDRTLYPDLIVFITGRGPLRNHYEKRIREAHFEHVQFHLPWLEHEEYPLLLGSASLGVCLHTSSSGLDLPMKVVDMFGAGLPVAAVAFQCLPELVQHEFNGFVFRDSAELAEQIKGWFRRGENPKKKLFRENLKAQFGSGGSGRGGWEENWGRVARGWFEK